MGLHPGCAHALMLMQSPLLDPAKAPESQEKEHKQKHLEARLERHCHFTPSVCSVDGALERGEAKTLAKSPAAKLASKWEMSCPQARGGVKSA